MVLRPEENAAFARGLRLVGRYLDILISARASDNTDTKPKFSTVGESDKNAGIHRARFHSLRAAVLDPREPMSATAGGCPKAAGLALKRPFTQYLDWPCHRSADIGELVIHSGGIDGVTVRVTSRPVPYCAA